MAALALWGSGVNAVNQRFEERFVLNGTIDQSGESGTYNFDKAHSVIAFKVKHNGLIEIPGFFRDFTGAIVYDAKTKRLAAHQLSVLLSAGDPDRTAAAPDWRPVGPQT